MNRLRQCRIVHVLGALVAGGAERFVVDILCAWKRAGESVGLVALSRRQDAATAALHRRLDEHGVPWLVGPTKRLRLRALIWYKGLMEVIDPSVLHLHTPNTELAEFLVRWTSRRSGRLFRTIHNSVPPGGALKRLALRRNPAVASIACGEAAARACGAHVRGQMLSIPNGVEFGWPIRTRGISAASKKALGLSAERFHFLAVGRMAGSSLQTAQKAHDILISAWRQSGLTHSGAQLNLLGDGPLRPALEELAGDDPGIVFHGIHPRVSRWLLAADAFVMPSRWEGLPIAGIEAVGTGLPCVFSDLPPLRELRPPVAYWTRAGDVSDLGRGLSHCRHGSQLPAVQATEAIRRRFAIDTVASRYLAAYGRRATGNAAPRPGAEVL